MIVRNAARCGNCGDVVESTTRHDFVQCSCKNVFVDGGKVYLRHGFVDAGDYEDLSEVVEDEEAKDDAGTKGSRVRHAGTKERGTDGKASKGVT